MTKWFIHIYKPEQFIATDDGSVWKHVSVEHIRRAIKDARNMIANPEPDWKMETLQPTLERLIENGIADMKKSIHKCDGCGEEHTQGFLSEDGSKFLCEKNNCGLIQSYGHFNTIKEYNDRERIEAEKTRKYEERVAKLTARGLEICGRCGGYGIIDAYRYVNGGVCFDCGGSGEMPKNESEEK